MDIKQPSKCTSVAGGKTWEPSVKDEGWNCGSLLPLSAAGELERVRMGVTGGKNARKLETGMRRQRERERGSNKRYNH